MTPPPGPPAAQIEGGKEASTNPDYWDPDAGLFKAVFDVGLTFNATSQDAVELQAFAYSQLCQHTPYYPEIDCELQSDQMSVCVVLKCKQFQMSKQAVQMSYMYSIWELWEMKTVRSAPRRVGRGERRGERVHGPAPRHALGRRGCPAVAAAPSRSPT